MNILKEAGHVLATVAPTLATAVGGPFAGMAVSGIEKVFGIDSSTTPDAKQAQIEQALLTATPEQILALKQAEQNFQVQMKTLGIQEEQLTFTDLASARAMQVATKDPTAARLAWLIIGGFLFISLAQMVAMVMFAAEMAALPPQVWLQIGNVSGYLANEAKQAAAFYFGSTAGSQAKDVTIADIAKQT